MKNLSNEELCALAQDGNIEAQGLLLENNKGLIRKIANEVSILEGLEFRYTGLDCHDLGQAGGMGLLRAIKSFDFAREVKFITYAAPAIRNSMINLVHKSLVQWGWKRVRDEEGYGEKRVKFERRFQWFYLKEPIPDNWKVRRIEAIADPYATLPLSVLIEKESLNELYEALSRVSFRYQTYLLYRFGFVGGIEHSLAETAKHFRLSESRAKHTEILALKELCEKLPWHIVYVDKSQDDGRETGDLYTFTPNETGVEFV